MLNRIIAWSLNNRAVTLFAAVILLVGGGYAALTAPIDVFPDLTAPTVTVLAEVHGMAPEEVEALVTFPIETAVNGAAGVRRVRSSSAQGIAIVWVEFAWGTDIFRARQIVSEKLALVNAQLPPEMPPPVLAPITSIMGEILLIGMTSETVSAMEVRTAADAVVRRRLLAVPGVAQVVPIGGEVKQYQVLVDPDRLPVYGVSLAAVVRAARESNAVASGGVYQDAGREVLIRGLGRVRDLEHLGQTVVAERNGTPVLLRDVAEIRIGPKPRLGTASVNAEPAVVLSIQKQPDANTLELTERIDAELDQMQAAFGGDIVMHRSVFRQADFIDVAVHNVLAALRDGAILVIVILFLFLWNVRTTAISVLAIPLALSAAVLAMRVAGITINTMTLGGMAIAIGALVDDAIIDVENTFRRLREENRLPVHERRPVLTVVRDAASEVRAPILYATLVITVVFVPLFFLSGVEGRMLRPLGFAYVVSIFASLAVAVTVTPVLCYYLLPGSHAVARERESWLVEWLKRRYERVLQVVLRHPLTVAWVSAMVVVATVAVVPALGRGFLPEFQEGTLTISAVTLPGTGLDESDRMGQRVEQILLAHPAVMSTTRRTGRAELDEHAQGTNAAEIDVRLDGADHELDMVIAELRRALTQVPGLNVTIGQPIGHRIDHMLSGTRAAIAIKIFGPDLYELRRLAESVRSVVEPVPGVVDLTVEQQADVPQLRIESNRTATARYGITPGHLLETVDVALNGQVVSQVLEGQHPVDLVVRLPDERRVGSEAVRRVPVDAAGGAKVPMSLVATVREDRGPNVINRENVQRKLVVQSNVQGRDVGSVVDDIRERVAADVTVPEGYYIEYGGQFESGQRAARAILILSLFSVAVIGLLLFQAFGNARHAALVMVNLPLALIGGVAATIVAAGGVINVATLVGFITLFGIAVRNGILLVSHYQTLLDAGVTPDVAVFRGSMERLNPILMTALTAALALLPLALGGGEPGKELQAPMAVVVLGGLLTSTALNMIVVPALFLRWGIPRRVRA